MGGGGVGVVGGWLGKGGDDEESQEGEEESRGRGQ